LHKSVKTDTFNQPVQLRHETLSVNRTEPGAPGANPEAPLPPTGRTDGQNAQAAQQPDKTFQDQDIVIQLYREEPVVQKKVVPSGQIVAQKQAQTQQQNVQEQVRREDIQINKSGEAGNVNVAPNLQNTMQNQEQPPAMGAPSSGQEKTSGAQSGGTDKNQ
jgi:stress response protein YsnF